MPPEQNERLVFTTNCLTFIKGWYIHAIPLQNAAKKEFGKLLKTARNARGFTLRQLAESAGMRHPNISALEAGRLSAGPEVVERLANALDLKNAQRQEFCLWAATTRKNPMLRELASCPPVIANLLAAYLQGKMINPNRITGFARFELPAIFEDSYASHGIWLAWMDTKAPASIALKRELCAYLKQHPEQEALLVILLPKGRQFVLTVSGCEF